MRRVSCVTSLCLLALAALAPAAGAQEPPVSPRLFPEPPPQATAAREPLPLTMIACVALARKRSETLAIQQELIAATEGRFLQALSGALPRVSFVSSDKRQDGSGSSAFTLRNIPDRHFTFTQPLFSGFKEFAAMAGARAERRERQFLKTRAEHTLFVDVADAFYLLLEQRKDLDALEATRQALEARLNELKEREQLGRSRTSEVASAEVQLRRVEAEMERVRSQETTAAHLLEFLTGLPHIGVLSDPDQTVLALLPEEDYVAKAPARPDVRASEEAWRVTQKELRVAQAGFWPTVDAEGNYYVDRAGVAEDITWDATLTVAVPLFEGGRNLGAVREARANEREAKLTFERAEREAVLDIRDVYAKLQAELARRAALQRALDAAEENYRLQAEDYRRSLVNNLDVLQALETLQDSRRDLLASAYEVKRLYEQLRAATGEIPHP
jgi:outer membrane protein TolC